MARHRHPWGGSAKRDPPLFCNRREMGITLTQIRPTRTPSLRSMPMWKVQARQIDPTGKSLLIFGSRVKPRNQKYFAFVVRQITGLNPSVSPDKRGVAHVTKRAVGCDGRGCADDERHGCVRRSRVVLAPRRWRQVRENKFSLMTVTRKPDHRGELDISRKTVAQGKPDASAGPVCSCAFCFVQSAHETAGAARTRLSLRPLFSRAKIFKPRAHWVARMRRTSGCHRPPTGRRVAPPDDRLRRAIRYSGDTDDRIEKLQADAPSEPARPILR